MFLAVSVYLFVMSTTSIKRRLPPSSLLSRLLLGTTAVFGMVGWLAKWQIESYEDNLALEQQETQNQEVLRQLRSDAAALSASMNGDEHELLAQSYGQMEYAGWVDTPKAIQNFRSEMMSAAQNLEIDAQITTYRLKNQESKVVDARSNELRPDALQSSSAPRKTVKGGPSMPPTYQKWSNPWFLIKLFQF